MLFRLAVRWILYAGIVMVLLPQFGQAAGGDALKIGVVDFQKLLNLSEAGKRSQKILWASKQQKESELKATGDKLKKKIDALRNNIMLNDAAKSKKQKELRVEERKLRSDLRASERELQREQMKASDSIYTQVKTVIGLIAKEQKFDFVVEKTTARSILYARGKMEDITDIVIRRYNGISQ